MARVLSGTELEEHARSAYRRADYQVAIETIRKAIQASKDPIPSQLDLLVASQTKTEDYDGALANAKLLIRQFGSDPVGYFRSAHVLQKINRSQAALKIYERGLKMVPMEHTSYPRLQQKHQQLAVSLTPSARWDPLARLPLELVEAVLLSMSFKQRMPCLRVCKSWQKLLYSMPQLWTSLDLSQARRQVRPAFVNRCFNASQHRIQDAFIRHVKNIEPVIDALAKKCNTLSSLTIHSADALSRQTINCFSVATNLSSLTLHLSNITQADAGAILRGCRQLSSFACSGLYSRNERSNSWEHIPGCLEELSLEAAPTPYTAYIDLHSILNHASGLKSLRLKSWHAISAGDEIDFSHLTGLECLRLGGLDASITGLPISLTELETHATMTPFNLPRLEILQCKKTNDAQVLLKHDGVQPGAQLVSLHIESVISSERDWVTLLKLDRLTELRNLTLRQTRNVDEDVVSIIVERLTKLETIDFWGSDITGYGIKCLVTRLPRLKRLSLERCASFSADAVAWARDQGIQLLVGESGNNMGRNVRYGQ